MKALVIVAVLACVLIAIKRPDIGLTAACAVALIGGIGLAARRS